VAGASTGNLLETFFNNSTIQFIFWAFMIVSFFFFFVAIIIGIARSELTGEDNKHPKLKVLRRAAISLLTILFMPVIFGVAVQAASLLLGAVVEIMGGSVAEESALAQKIFEICLPVRKDTGTELVPWNETIPFIELRYSLSDFNYIVGFVGSAVLLCILAAAALRLVGRLIDVLMLFLISPFVLAASPLDDGQRFGVWRDLVVSKLLGVAGMVLSLYLYFILMDVLSSIFTGTTFLSGVFYLVFAIGGAFSALKGGILISNMVGHNTAMIDGQQQNNAAQMIGHTAMRGAGMAWGLAKGSLGLMGRGGRKLGGALFGGHGEKPDGGGAAKETAETVAGVAGGTDKPGASHIESNLQSTTNFAAQKEGYEESRKGAGSPGGAAQAAQGQPSSRQITQNLNSGQQGLAPQPLRSDAAPQAPQSAPSTPEPPPASSGALSQAMNDTQKGLGAGDKGEKGDKK
jgi:hypothetical protein